jgi:hypothetical protein
LRNTLARSSQDHCDHSFHASRARLPRGLDGHFRFVLAGHVPRGQEVPVTMRHHRLVDLAGPDLLAADDQGELDFLPLHLGQGHLQRRALGRPRCIGADWLVDGNGNLNITAHPQSLLPPKQRTVRSIVKKAM